MASFYKRIGELGFDLQLTQEAKDFLADKGYDPAYGARPLKRAIQTYLEDVLAEVLLAIEPSSDKRVITVEKVAGEERLIAHVAVGESVQRLA